MRPPVGLHRSPPSKGKIRLVARLSPEDVRPGGLSLHGGQICLPHGAKAHSKQTFDTVFSPDSNQAEINSSLLPDLLNGLLSGIDGSLVSFGGVSKRKDSVLFSSLPDQPGLFQSAISSLFHLLDSSPDRNGWQLKISALHFSQRANAITDLLSQFNTDPRRFPVRIVEDVVEGPRVENASEIRVESMDQAMFYLNTVIDHRLVEEEEAHRSCHLFFSVSLVRRDRRASLHLVDLGMGERNSARGALTTPAIGNLLIALCQGQKHLPTRDNTLSSLLRCGVGRARQTTVLCSFAEKIDDNENILQLASKLSKARKNPRRGSRTVADSSSISSNDRKRRSDLESSSEQSGAETVIFMGSGFRRPSDPSRLPSLHSPDGGRPLKTIQLQSPMSNGHGRLLPSPSSIPNGRSPSRTSVPSPYHSRGGGSMPPLLKDYTPFFAPYSRVYTELCSPPGTSKGVIEDEDEDDEERPPYEPPLQEKKKSRQKEEEERRERVLLWMDECTKATDEGKESLADDEEEDEEEEERERDLRIPRPLEDIQELDEDSLKESIRSSRLGVTITNNKHPLSILSHEALDTIECPNDSAFHEDNDDDLEKAMEASVSSIISHELLSRVKEELMTSLAESERTYSKEPSETDVYRRASHLEEYAEERLREMQAEENEKKKRKRLPLPCCHSMASSTSTDQVERKHHEEEERERKEELRRRRDELKEEEEELKKRRDEIRRQLEPPLLRQLTQQISSFTLKAAGFKPKSSSHLHPSGSDSLPTTPTISHRKVIIPSPSLSNCSSPAHRLPSNGKSSLPVRRDPKRNGSRSRSSREREEGSRKGSDDFSAKPSSIPLLTSTVSIRSPYAKVTPAKTGGSGADSSGRGSDDNGSSIVGGTSTGKRNKKRESYSASSGYESASGDYRTFHHTPRGDPKFDRFRFLDKRCGIAAREVDKLREQQRTLQRELTDAKTRIGEGVEEWRGGLEGKGTLSHTTLVDTLLQENRILEKRLVACQNHTMLVTSLM